MAKTDIKSQLFYNQLSIVFIKLVRFEFWSYAVFYVPLAFYWLYLGFRARSFLFFSAVNPSMYFGGFVNNSKWDILKDLDPAYLPISLLISPKEADGDILCKLEECGLKFPIVAKPNKGERGFLVEKISCPDDLKVYKEKSSVDFILQEYIDYPLELGIMYYRYPGESKGDISSIVKKKFLQIEGDGNSNLKQLIQRSPRGRFYQSTLHSRYAEELNRVLPAGECLLLSPIGNHNLGTIFLNACDMKNDRLIEVFDNISKNIDGFCFGRFDIRVSSMEDLMEGKNIKIMELNGANSEPAHIYHPNFSIFKAYRDLFWHWRLMYHISIQNHQNGVPYIPFLQGLNVVISHLRLKRKANKPVAKNTAYL